MQKPQDWELLDEHFAAIKLHFGQILLVASAPAAGSASAKHVQVFFQFLYCLRHLGCVVMPGDIVVLKIVCRVHLVTVFS